MSDQSLQRPIPANEQVRAHFDAEAATWGRRYEGAADTLSQLDLAARLEAATRMIVQACAELPAEARVLEVGCGTGAGTESALHVGAKIVATDLSFAMIREMKRKCSAALPCVADVETLPFRDGFFHVVLALGVLEYVDNHERAVGEFRRVLKPSGTLIISIPNRSSLFRRLHASERKLTGPLRSLLVKRNSDSRGNRYRHKSWTMPEAKMLLEQHGLELAETELMTYGLRLPMAETWRSNLALCRLLNRWLPADGVTVRRLACTAVIRARASRQQDNGVVPHF